jgi:hypothetical protein
MKEEKQRVNAIAAPAPYVFPSRQPFLGVLTLDTHFPRLVGDIGNPTSFPVPTLTRVVRGVGPRDAVQSADGQRAAGLFDSFCATMRQLEREGAAAITTSCGFLVLLQERLQAAARVPVVTSSLTLLPGLLERHARAGVLTISAQKLDEYFLLAAGVPIDRVQDVIVEGVDPDGYFARSILGNEPALDFAAARREMIAAAQRLAAREPCLTDVVLECTNMPPYAAAVETACALRCWSLLESTTLLAPFQSMDMTLSLRLRGQ